MKCCKALAKFTSKGVASKELSSNPICCDPLCLCWEIASISRSHPSHFHTPVPHGCGLAMSLDASSLLPFKPTKKVMRCSTGPMTSLEWAFCCNHGYLDKSATVEAVDDILFSVLNARGRINNDHRPPVLQSLRSYVPDGKGNFCIHGILPLPLHFCHGRYQSIVFLLSLSQQICLISNPLALQLDNVPWIHPQRHSWLQAIREVKGGVRARMRREGK